jgi:hypothetical protein
VLGTEQEGWLTSVLDVCQASAEVPFNLFFVVHFRFKGFTAKPPFLAGEAYVLAVDLQEPSKNVRPPSFEEQANLAGAPINAKAVRMKKERACKLHAPTPTALAWLVLNNHLQSPRH